MEGKIYLDLRQSQKRKKGFPLVCDLSAKGKRLFFALKLYFEKSEWDQKKQLPINNKEMFIVVRRKKNILEDVLLDVVSGKNYTLDQVKSFVLEISKIGNNISYISFFEDFIKEKQDAGKEPTAQGYQNVCNVLKIYRKDILFDDLDYNLLNSFKIWQLNKGNTKSTVHTYLSKCRAVYNEAVRRGYVAGKSPFEGVFNGISVKHNRTKKRHLSKESILKLADFNTSTFYHQRAIDLFVLMFYFGGQDLNDIYYLKNSQINKGRVYFIRGKLGGNGYQFDLQITEKAQKIIDKYKVPGEFVFPWPKDFNSYKSFRDNIRRSLDYAQDKLSLEVLPLGGKIRLKVARHTFATIGKNLFIEADLLRELMGHERNDVDTIYKDKYPEATRDAAHLKIID